MQIYQTGRVRMGPGGAANFDLYPGGSLKIKGSLTAGGTTFPDYVFEPGYSRMPLTDLKTFIVQNKRLPDISSAQEVRKQGGHNMTELQLKLLEKIEELTLYTLEQEAKQAQNNTELKSQGDAIRLLETRLATMEKKLSNLVAADFKAEP